MLPTLGLQEEHIICARYMLDEVSLVVDEVLLDYFRTRLGSIPEYVCVRVCFLISHDSGVQN